MMMGMRGLGDYAGASSITLHDGTVISDPANTQATSEQCVPFECGVDPTNQAARYWCAYWNQVQMPACEDPVCAPYRAEVPGCNILAPSPAAPAPSPTPAVMPPTLTPANIVQPLPDITQANTAPPPSTPSCWCSINQLINQNPLVAAAVLAGIALLIVPKGRR